MHNYLAYELSLISRFAWSLVTGQGSYQIHQQGKMKPGSTIFQVVYSTKEHRVRKINCVVLQSARYLSQI